MMRRLVLRRGLTALLGMAAASSVKESGPVGIVGGNSVMGPAGRESGDDQRGVWAAIIDKKRNEIWRRQTNLHQAWHSQHMDLLALQSTSQSWRATVMLSRIAKEQREMETLDARIRAIWQEPLSKLRDVVANWIQVN